MYLYSRSEFDALGLNGTSVFQHGAQLIIRPCHNEPDIMVWIYSHVRYIKPCLLFFKILIFYIT